MSAAQPQAEPPIEKRVRAVLLDVLAVTPERLVDEARLAEDLAVDSLDWVEIAVGLGEAFDHDFIDEPQPATVAALVALVRAQLEG